MSASYAPHEKGPRMNGTSCPWVLSMLFGGGVAILCGSLCWHNMIQATRGEWHAPSSPVGNGTQRWGFGHLFGHVWSGCLRGQRSRIGPSPSPTSPDRQHQSSSVRSLQQEGMEFADGWTTSDSVSPWRALYLVGVKVRAGIRPPRQTSRGQDRQHLLLRRHDGQAPNR